MKIGLLFNSNNKRKKKKNFHNNNSPLDNNSDLKNLSRKRNHQDLIDLRTYVNVTALESLRGCEKTIRIDRYSVCNNCTSSKKRRTERIIIDKKESRHMTKCNACEGCRMILKPDIVKFNVPMGVSTGKEIVINGCGDKEINKGDVGDLFVFIKVEPHPRFLRAGNHALFRVQLPYSSFMLGCSVCVPTLYNGDYLIVLPPLTKPGTAINLSHIGFYDPDTHEFGDMHLFLACQPLSPEEKKLLQFFNPRSYSLFCKNK
jgi:DnaJ-class molecular chaperone